MPFHQPQDCRPAASRHRCGEGLFQHCVWVAGFPVDLSDDAQSQATASAKDQAVFAFRLEREVEPGRRLRLKE